MKKAAAKKPAPVAPPPNAFTLLAEMVENGWCLDCGKTGIRIATQVQGGKGDYIAAFYELGGKGVYASGKTLDAAIIAASELARD